MIKIKRLIAAGALGIFAFSAVGCEMIQKTPEAIKNTVVAKVGDYKITKGEVDELVEPYLAQYGDYENDESLSEQVQNLRVQGLNLLVEDKMLELKAEEMNVMPTQEEIDEQVQSTLDQMIETYDGEDEFNTALENANLTLDEYKENVTKNIKSNLIANKVSEELFKDVNITDEDVSNYYNENLDSYKSATVSHILIADETKAKEIREKAVNGEDFATLAKENSEDTGTAEDGGSLGTVAYDTTSYVQEFTDAFKALGEGEISEPVKSTYGYHIIKVTDIKQKTLDEVKDDIKTTLENEKKNEIYETTIEQWKEEYKVKTYEDKLS